MDGWSVGGADGRVDGCEVGRPEGRPLGTVVGNTLGFTEGCVLGLDEGLRSVRPMKSTTIDPGEVVSTPRELSRLHCPRANDTDTQSPYIELYMHCAWQYMTLIWSPYRVTSTVPVRLDSGL